MTRMDRVLFSWTWEAIKLGPFGCDELAMFWVDVLQYRWMLEMELPGRKNKEIDPKIVEQDINMKNKGRMLPFNIPDYCC